MKAQITVYSLASDDDCGTKAEVFATEEEAVGSLLDRIVIEDYTKEDLTRFYFFPDELPEEFEDWYELLSSLKSDYDTYNIDEHTLTVEIHEASDELLTECLTIMRSWCLTLGEYDLDYSKDQALIERIADHLGDNQV